MSDASWALFLILLVGGIVIATGTPLGPILLFLALFALLFAYRFSYFLFYIMVFLMPFLGIIIAIPTGTFTFGERAFGGSIDIGVAEAILLVLLVAWAFKIIFLWLMRRDRNWKPRFPLGFSYLGIVTAHLLSLASPLSPDPLQVIKYTARPVLLAYLGYVALPVNLIRSKRRLIAVLRVLSAVGTIGALNGLISLFFVDASSQFIRRAHPLPLFGVPILGDNHNLLAELMVVTVMLTIALVYLTPKGRLRNLLVGSAVLQFAIGLLTFSRTGWICFSLQALFLAVIEFRDVLKKYTRHIVILILLMVPFAGYMVSLSFSRVATSSNDTRMALAEIAWEVFRSSPIVGAGAGTFVGFVSSAQVFRIEFGDPLDSHGILQKLGAETGIIGLLAFAILVIVFFRIMLKRIHSLEHKDVRRITVLLTSAVLGSFVYQLFNTNYWTGKMWLPVGIALASIWALKDTSHG
ncbi:MAG: O-antigen ligase family protein [bacterium]|nr:O-antigen ligase family protein [bacterium]